MEVKFRIWNKKDKFWLPNCGLFHDGTIIEECVNDDTGEYSLEFVGDSDDHVVCLFTGAKDRNDMEIYSGDIIKIISKKDNTYQFGDVVYSTIYFSWQVDGFYGGDLRALTYDYYLEIVGNIYENKLSDFIPPIMIKRS